MNHGFAFECSGKISRVLAAKCALAIRVDALGETPDSSIGLESRAKVEERLLQLEGKVGTRLASQGKPVLNQQKYDKSANGIERDNIYEYVNDCVCATMYLLTPFLSAVSFFFFGGGGFREQVQQLH